MSQFKDLLIKKFKPHSKGDERFKHSESVYKEALKLARFHELNISEEKIYLAAMLHDYAKFETLETYKRVIEEEKIPNDCLKEDPKILHALLGHYIVKKELGITDTEILNAICYHTTGRQSMSPLEELIFLADFIEENRKGKYFEKIRNIAYKNYKKAIAMELELLIRNITSKKLNINENTLEAYSYYKKYI